MRQQVKIVKMAKMTEMVKMTTLSSFSVISGHFGQKPAVMTTYFGRKAKMAKMAEK